MTKPPLHRIVNALVLASVVAAWPTYIAIPFVISAGPAVLWIVVIGFLVALAHALLLGLPLVMLLAKRGLSGPGVAMLAGGLVGALPVTIPMLAGGLEPAALPATLFCFCGVLGGATFNFVVSRGNDTD